MGHGNGQALGPAMKHEDTVNAVAFSLDRGTCHGKLRQDRPTVGRNDGPTAGPAHEA